MAVELPRDALHWCADNGPGILADESISYPQLMLKQKRSAAELARLREITRVAADQPIPRIAPRESGAAPPERLDTELQFFTEMESTFFNGMKAYLRDTLGVKAPVSARRTDTAAAAIRCCVQLPDGHRDGHTWQHRGGCAQHADGE